MVSSLRSMKALMSSSSLVPSKSVLSRSMFQCLKWTKTRLKVSPRSFSRATMSICSSSPATVEGRPDAGFGDVREHPRDADARLTRLLVAEVTEVPQIVVHLANRPGPRGDFLLGKVLEIDLVRKTRARGGRMAMRNDGRLGRRGRGARRGTLLRVGRSGRVAGGHFCFRCFCRGKVHPQNTKKSISIFCKMQKKVFCAASCNSYK